jgi:hypothetical protein
LDIPGTLGARAIVHLRIDNAQLRDVVDLKTEKSRRTLALPEVCLGRLRAHRTRQLEERLKAGDVWQGLCPE